MTSTACYRADLTQPTLTEFGGVGATSNHVVQPDARVDAGTNTQHALDPHDEQLEAPGPSLTGQLAQALEQQLQALVVQKVLRPDPVPAAQLLPQLAQAEDGGVVQEGVTRLGQVAVVGQVGQA